MSDNTVGVEDEKVINTDEPAKYISREEQEESKSAKSYNTSSDGQDLMRVKVASPFRDYYDGQAFSLSAENLTGPFDVLPKHHSFISLLSPCELVVRTPEDQNGPIRIKITGGLIHVKANAAIIFLDV